MTRMRSSTRSSVRMYVNRTHASAGLRPIRVVITDKPPEASLRLELATTFGTISPRWASMADHRRQVPTVAELAPLQAVQSARTCRATNRAGGEVHRWRQRQERCVRGLIKARSTGPAFASNHLDWIAWAGGALACDTFFALAVCAFSKSVIATRRARTAVAAS